MSFVSCRAGVGHSQPGPRRRVYMTTFILLSNLNEMKMFSGATIVLSTMATPGEDFMYLFVLSPVATS